MSWPPDYSIEFSKRASRIKKMMEDPSFIIGAKEYYKTRPAEFIEDWCCTYDPRNSSKKLPTLMPFILFPRQRELVEFLQGCLDDEENGLVEKARDMGATWLSAAFSVWVFIFREGASIGWGSRKEMYVDRIDDPDSIFEKIRMTIDTLPPFLRPKGYDRKKHANYMKIVNPENGATITGEAGDNIGRGGRKLLFFKDESAHYDRPELIEAALGDNTNVQIDISSVFGTGNVFHRKRENGKVWTSGAEIESGETRVFIFDWRDHPNKSQEWYDKRRARAEAEGLLPQFKQEVDRDYSGAIENVVIPSEWVQAAIDLHLRVPMVTTGQIFAGLDVADEGGDLNAFASRNGIKLDFVEKWGKGDTFQTAKKAIQYSKEQKVLHISYDSIGVGAGVKAAFNQMDTGKIQAKAWNASERAFFPERRVVSGDSDSPKNKDFYSNLKAQAWWELRKKFYASYRALKTGKINIEDVENCIVLSGDLEYLHEITNELSRPVFEYDNKGRLKIDKKPNGAKSPNMADAIVMAFWPKTGGGFYA